MRYDLNHSRDLGAPQPVEEVMGAQEPALPKADGSGIKRNRSVRTYVPRAPKPTKDMKTIDPATWTRTSHASLRWSAHGRSLA
jgi:hypothetical protein